MTHVPNMSRRDWFRLQLPHQNKLLGEASTSSPASGLRQVDHPPNHDGMDLDQLPPLREAMLTDEEVTALFDDIGNLASDIQLMQRFSPHARANVDATSTLTRAKFEFIAGKIKRLQIRYRWQDTLWIDTLEQQASAIRLIRVSHQGM